MERNADDSEERAPAGLENGGTEGAAARASDRSDRSRPAAAEEEVRRRAYDLYTARGGSAGSDLDDWFAAEREVRERGIFNHDEDDSGRNEKEMSDYRETLGDMRGDVSEGAESVPRTKRPRRKQANRRERAD